MAHQGEYPSLLFLSRDHRRIFGHVGIPSHDNIEWAIVENDGADLVAGGPLQDARISAMYWWTLNVDRIGE